MGMWDGWPPDNGLGAEGAAAAWAVALSELANLARLDFACTWSLEWAVPSVYMPCGGCGVFAVVGAACLILSDCAASAGTRQ